MSKATDDPTDSGATVHIDAALIEAKRQVRDLLAEANKIPSDTDSHSPYRYFESILKNFP